MSVLGELVKVLKLVSLHKKNGIVIAKKKVKVYIFKTKFILINSLFNALKTLVSKTIHISLQIDLWNMEYYKRTHLKNRTS